VPVAVLVGGRPAVGLGNGHGVLLPGVVDPAYRPCYVARALPAERG
jgi:hypothetical protein